MTLETELSRAAWSQQSGDLAGLDRRPRRGRRTRRVRFGTRQSLADGRPNWTSLRAVGLHQSSTWRALEGRRCWSRMPHGHHDGMRVVGRETVQVLLMALRRVSKAAAAPCVSALLYAVGVPLSSAMIRIEVMRRVKCDEAKSTRRPSALRGSERERAQELVTTSLLPSSGLYSCWTYWTGRTTKCPRPPRVGLSRGIWDCRRPLTG